MSEKRRDVAILREPSFEELEAVFRRHEEWLQSDGEDGECADLSHTDLRCAQLDYIHFPYANLSHSDLTGANLDRTSFEECNLTGAILEKASLRHANLEWADLTDANLTEARLKPANLRNATLRNAQLRKATFASAVLWGTNLRGAKCHDTNFAQADLEAAELDADQLAGATLTRARLPDDYGEHQDYIRTLWRIDEGMKALVRAQVEQKRQQWRRYCSTLQAKLRDAGRLAPKNLKEVAYLIDQARAEHVCLPELYSLRPA